MEGQRDESGRYLPEVRQAVIEEVRRSGVWAAVERFGVAVECLEGALRPLLR